MEQRCTMQVMENDVLDRECEALTLRFFSTAARNALKRKKQHEHSLEQTLGQIQMLEQQIYSIESANINQETLVAMKNAGAAMKQIHGKMTMEDVDTTMYEPCIFRTLFFVHWKSYTLHPQLWVPSLRNVRADHICQGTTSRATRTDPRDRQCNHQRAYHRAHRRR